MSSIYIFSIVLLVDWVLGFAIGWYSRGAMSRSVGIAPSSSLDDARDEAAPDVDLEQLKSLQHEVRQELSIHAAALSEFERFLKALLADSDEAVAKSLSHQLHHVRGANRQVTGVLQRASGQLSYYVRFCGQLLAKEQRHVDDYQGKTAELSEILAIVDGQSAVEGQFQELASKVQDLQQENTQLRQDLDDCQNALSEQMSAADAAAANVRVDVVTQLPNRRAFEEKVAELQTAFERDRKPYVVVFLDVDDFQQINEQYGHAVGDAALAMLGRVFRECQRPDQHMSRFDGEQFALLLTSDDLERARAVAEQYREKVEAACLRFADSKVRTTASVGVARSIEGESRRGVIVRAAAALAAARDAGGNQVCLDNETKSAS